MPLERRNEWYVSPTGYGKSTFLWNKYPEAYRKTANKWWINYQDEDVVIIEELSPKKCEHLGYHVKIWADAFPFMAEEKGSGRYIRPKKIIVTSNYTIKECFLDPVERAAINGRFRTVEFQHWNQKKWQFYSKKYNKQL